MGGTLARLWLISQVECDELQARGPTDAVAEGVVGAGTAARARWGAGVVSGGGQTSPVALLSARRDPPGGAVPPTVGSTVPAFRHGRRPF